MTVILQDPLTDDDQFTKLVEDTQNRLLVLAEKILRDPHEANDVVNEGYLRLWQVLQKKTIRSPTGWLLRTVRNLAIDAYRRRRTRTTTEGDPDTVADSGPSPDDRAATHLDVSYLLESATKVCGQTSVAIYRMMKGNGVPACEVAKTYKIKPRQAYHKSETVQRYLSHFVQ